MTETFIYYELHILGVRGPSWGTLPHKCIFFFPVFLFSLSSAVTLALRSLLPSRYALRNVLLIIILLLTFVHNYVLIL